MIIEATELCQKDVCIGISDVR